MNLPEGIVPKSFWDRREGWAGSGILGVLTAVVLIFFYKFGDVLTQGLTNFIEFLGLMMVAGVLTVAAIGLFLVLYGIRYTLVYMFQSISRRITSCFVEVDPIGIQRTFTARRKKDQATLYSRMGDLAKAIKRTGTRIDKAKEGKDDAMQRASVARKAGAEAKLELVFQLRQGGRLQKKQVRFETVLTKMEGLYRFLKKLYEVIDYKIRDMEAEVETAADERAGLQDAYSAYESARSAITGNPDELALFEMAQQANADQVDAWDAEIQHFMQMSERFMQSVDIENGIIQAEGLKMLEDWEAKLDGAMERFGVNKQLILAEATDPGNVVDLTPLPKPVPELVAVNPRPARSGRWDKIVHKK